jgi:hypothetical protein
MTAETKCRVGLSLLAAKRPISIRVKRMVTAAMEMMMAPLALLRMSGKNDFFF